MERVNIDSTFEDFNNPLEDEKLTGWSATCLDQTISYYVDCNYNEISQHMTLEDKSDFIEM
uniref:Uncharacterized protein n=1 Tax=Trichogloeopsis pedicellata TaxID=1495610 RepID=A0A1G4P0N5_9FLOR|nr:Hypothetical protein ORF_8 [Trichogloeopsis pedicellata]SCW24386.1 Hypothetical protein ORF_8 [Trichogloeopsis pedicellata]